MFVRRRLGRVGRAAVEKVVHGSVSSSTMARVALQESISWRRIDMRKPAQRSALNFYNSLGSDPGWHLTRTTLRHRSSLPTWFLLCTM